MSSNTSGSGSALAPAAPVATSHAVVPARVVIASVRSSTNRSPRASSTANVRTIRPEPTSQTATRFASPVATSPPDGAIAASVDSDRWPICTCIRNGGSASIAG
jgi:hypothetical protein